MTTVAVLRPAKVRGVLTFTKSFSLEIKICITFSPSGRRAGGVGGVGGVQCHLWGGGEGEGAELLPTGGRGEGVQGGDQGGGQVLGRALPSGGRGVVGVGRMGPVLQDLRGREEAQEEDLQPAEGVRGMEYPKEEV